MMPKDGGPAFPNSKGDEGNVSVRDYFAAAALTGLINFPDNVEWSEAQVALAAYRQADAMLAEREKEQTNANPT